MRRGFNNGSLAECDAILDQFGTIKNTHRHAGKEGTTERRFDILRQTADVMAGDVGE